MDTESFARHLPRIAAMAAGDEAMYYLALHSFIEGFINSLHPELRVYEDWGKHSSFSEKIRVLADDLKAEGRLSGSVRQTLGTVRTGHQLTNQIRHDFQSVSCHEAEAATHTFLNWCRAVGFESPVLDQIAESLALWTGKRSPAELLDQARALQLELNGLRRDYRAVEPQLQALDRLQTDLTTARSALRDQLAGLADVQSHLRYLERFTTYTRSRRDYERSVLSLSSEQSEAMDRARTAGDFLVTGGAGTGKTLVLLHALDHDLASADEELGLIAEKPFALLTYTKTLVRFNHYLSRILGNHSATPVIATVDAFLLERLRALTDGAYVVYSGSAEEVFGPVIEPYASDALPFARIFHEIEEEIFALGLDRETYGDGPERETIWSAFEACVAYTRETGAHTKNGASLAIARAVEDDAALRRRFSVRRIFVDETQDLSPTDLSTLKLLATDGIVMAGDPNQAIYRLGSTFKAAGISIQGRTRHLHRNFRNTGPICTLAERYRNFGRADETQPVGENLWAERDGPEPEFYIAESVDSALDLLIRRVRFFTDRLGYELDNLAVLTPTRDDVAAVRDRCKTAGIKASSPKSSSFDFETSPGVRVTTMHSAKGVEFPVVFLYMPGFSVRAGSSESEALQKERNLIYVALTRAMDNVQIIVTEPITVQSIRELSAVV